MSDVPEPSTSANFRYVGLNESGNYQTTGALSMDILRSKTSISEIRPITYFPIPNANNICQSIATHIGKKIALLLESEKNDDMVRILHYNGFESS